VLTSSLAAIHNTTPRKQRYDETSWSETDGDIDAYSKSKTLAERAAWEYVGGLPVDRGMELVSINPSVVLGPLLEPSGSTSVEIVRKFLAREVPGSPRYGLPMVDVRDVAEAHIRALQVPSAAGNRYLCSGPFHWLDDVAATLKRSGYNVPMRQLPNWLVRTVGLFDPTVRMIVRDLGVSYEIDNSKIRRDLNWSPRDIDRTVLDTAESLRAHGVV
jgi:dihydroflavonol-4-reductase